MWISTFIFWVLVPKLRSENEFWFLNIVHCRGQNLWHKVIKRKAKLQIYWFLSKTFIDFPNDESFKSDFKASQLCQHQSQICIFGLFYRNLSGSKKIITGLLIILDLLSSSVENGKHKLSMTMEMKEEWLSYRWFRRENSKFFLRSRSIEFEVGKCIVSWNVLRTSIIFLCLSLARELTSDFLCWLLLESFEAEAAASCSLASASLLR